MTVPTILEEIVQSSAALELASLDFVAVGGGPIKNTIGEALHENGVNLLNHFGATELGALAPIFRPDISYDWRYLRLRTDLGLELKHSSSSEGKKNEFKLIGRPFGSKVDFELQDSLELNPTNRDLEVKLLGRKDDLIVLATGEKVSPHLMEHTLEQDPRIKRAIIFGDGQFEVGVLVEPAIDVPPDTFVDSIWPVILDANTEVDQHACVTTKAAILVKPSQKTIPLSDKGTPQRKEVYSVFDSDIRSVYDRMQNGIPGISPWSVEPKNLRKSLRELVQSCLPPYIKPEMWEDEDDFFQLGLDSLQATRLRRSLDQPFRKSSRSAPYSGGLPLDFVYSHSSIEKLIEAYEDPTEVGSSSDAKIKIMFDLFEKYMFFSERGISVAGEHTVLLTGTTGSLGSHLLQVLSKHSRVSHVVCLVRPEPKDSEGNLSEAAMSAQRKALGDRKVELSTDTWSKVEVLAWQPGVHRLGLAEHDYYRLASSITHIFHGAWPMDFRMKLWSFETQIKTLQDLVSLARDSHRVRPHLKPRVILASSIAVLGNLAGSGSCAKLVPELPIQDPISGPLAMGYAEAKWVCEKVMESAYNSLGCEIQPMIVRIGQLSGSYISGYWSVKEHIPTIVKFSLAIGQLPDLRGVGSSPKSCFPEEKGELTVS